MCGSLFHDMIVCHNHGYSAITIMKGRKIGYISLPEFAMHDNMIMVCLSPLHPDI